ncbi:SHOCT domain-containing protein [Streptomyces sp. SP17BM10]|uniref:SHOCT domain-containing protein n=1 Tax=Streptomyces sp. SP17BM10 TaxID=3002530 RepID=UPI003FCCAACC
MGGSATWSSAATRTADATGHQCSPRCSAGSIHPSAGDGSPGSRAYVRVAASCGSAGGEGGSSAGELARLADLHAKDALGDEEFQQAKTKLLA